jgi:hypothetical protein
MSSDRIQRFFSWARMALLLALTSCGGGSAPEGGIGGSGLGTLRLSLTDSPACGFDSVNVTVEGLRVNQSAVAKDSDGGWAEITLGAPQKIDLLSLTNGVLLSLGQADVPAGTYTQLELVLEPDDAENPLANSVVPTGGSEVPLYVPGTPRAVLRTDVDIPVAANQLADFVVDFNACQSVVTQGNSGSYLLKPVIQVVPNVVSGVVGYVGTSQAASGTSLVALDQGGVPVKATVPDATGKFLLDPVAPGTYDLVVTALGHASAVVTGVVVADGLVTSVSTQAAAIDLPASPQGTIAGAVSSTVAPIEASVWAAQELTQGDTVTIDTTPADGLDGIYRLVLPVAAPLVAPFVPGATLAFVPDFGAAAKYTPMASLGDLTKTAPPVVLTAGSTSIQDFVFP